jgi:endonuclease III
MKNSKEHAQRLQRLYRELRRAHPDVEKTTYDDPVEALICGIISERMSESAAQKAFRDITRSFVDWNDLRVSRVEEVAEVLGRSSSCGRATALALTAALRGIFDEHHRISLQTLKKLGKRPARQDLEKIDGVSRFVINYCLLTSLEAHAIPITEHMADYLKQNGFVEANADEEDMEGFLTRCVAAKDAYEFYALLRRESESPKLVKKKAKSRSHAKEGKTGGSKE